MVRGETHEVVVPPHYAGYETVPDGLAAAVQAAVAPFGRRAARIEPPLKTLAAGAGLARYGRNNIAYVPGLGSYLMLAACVTDAPPPAAAVWSRRAGAGTLRALQRLPASVPHRGHPCRPLPAGHRTLPHLGQRGHGARSPPGSSPPGTPAPSAACAASRRAPRTLGVDLVVAPAEEFDAEESAAILAATPSADLPAGTRAKLERCGLDYDPQLIARNLHALISV